MIQIDPQMYRKYITTSSKGEPMLYVRLSKALYGLLQSVLFLYKKLRTELEDFGFAVNSYDPCVANKMVNGSQTTVTSHVDDLNISHKDSLEVTKFLHHFGQIYGERMTVHRSKVHEYLCMDLDFSTANTLKIGMIKYIKKIQNIYLRRSSMQRLRLLLSTYLMYAKIARTAFYRRNKLDRSTTVQPNYYLSVQARGRTFARQCHFNVPDVRHLMKTTGVS